MNKLMKHFFICFSAHIYIRIYTLQHILQVCAIFLYITSHPNQIRQVFVSLSFVNPLRGHAAACDDDSIVIVTPDYTPQTPTTPPPFLSQPLHFSFFNILTFCPLNRLYVRFQAHKTHKLETFPFQCTHLSWTGAGNYFFELVSAAHFSQPPTSPYF